MTEFPSNSNQPPIVKKEKAIDPVIVGEVHRRKRPLGKRLAENFINGEGARGVWGYVLFDVLIPAAKDMVVDAGTEALQRSFYGDSRAGSRRRPGAFSSGHTSYNQMYKSPNAPKEDRYAGRPPSLSRKARATHNFDEIILDSKVEAQEVIDRMFDLVNEYNVATVADLYNLCNIQPDMVDKKWGWTDLRGLGATRLRGGQYLLDLEKPEYLD